MMKRLSFLALVQHLLRCDYLIFVVQETILGIDASIGFNCEVCTQRSLFIFLTNLRWCFWTMAHMFFLWIFSAVAVTQNFLVVWKLYWFSGFFSLRSQNVTISNTSCVGIFVTSPGLCNLTSNLSPLHRPPPPLPTSPIARWLGEFFRDSAGAGVWNEGSHSYLHLLQIQ